jgi:methyl-accepting chemotaxis protein
LTIALLLSFFNVRSITKPLDELKDVAEVISSGDLTKAVNNNRGDELGALSQSMLKMQTWLNDVVAEVKSASQSVATASSEIAQGNTDLSSRTENQAANLQETAATIEELTATVKQSASTAQRASALALEATKAAEDGGQRVEGVIQTMTEIQSSSRKISEIISVIDSIAFQTNILALNAAVEAARAGEQGRGFNVVAGEVRMLAQRCAEAAREIKDLINESVEKVDSGSARVLAAGETMGAIVESVKRVSELVQEISTTSTEQSGGIDQASLAISHLDQMTQQNAALVEQSAAAAVSLDHQAQKLNSLVSVFRLRPATA